ncbi:MAG: 3-hydroxyacyl-ACP dehydratase FabZ [Candidatus Omnitrophota bacterium]|jgi:3-hydroxyacyl-[acyl-carrier-protein] dehydratase
MSNVESLDINQIQKILPQSYPFLFIDRVTELEAGKRVVAIKNLSITENFFQGHFPQNPVMPGVLIIEAMTQASLILYWSTYKDKMTKDSKFYLGSVSAKFKRPAFPGDQLKIEAVVAKLISAGGFLDVRTFVENIEIAQAELIFIVKP